MSEFEILRLIEVFGDAAQLLFLCGLQAILLVGLTWTFTKLFRNYRAAIRHNLWLAGLVAVAASPLWTIISRFFPISETAAQTLPRFGELPAIFQLFDGENSNSILTISNVGWLDWAAMTIVVFWLVGVFICLIRLAISHRTLKRIRRNAHSIAASESFYQSLSIPASLKLKRSSEISNPILVGVLHPVILLPAGIEEWASADEIRAIVRHETAHYERGDHLVRPLQSLLAAIFFFHPFVRYALNQLSLERESACDELVLDSGIAPENYKEVILKAAEQDVFERESRVLAFNSAKKLLARRINQIMSNKTKTMSRTRRVFLMAHVAFLLAFAVWFAAPNNFAQIQSSTAAAQTADEETFRKLYEEMRQMILRGDRQAFAKLLADDYTAIAPDGVTMTKEQVVERHIQKPESGVKFEKVNFGDLKVRVSNDAAVVTYTAEMSGSHQDRKFAHRARITDVWERKDGKWMSVASHASAVQ